LRQVASENTTESSATESGPQRKKSKKGLFSLLENLMDLPTDVSDNPQEAAKKEIQQYLGNSFPKDSSMDTCPLGRGGFTTLRSLDF